MFIAQIGGCFYGKPIMALYDSPSKNFACKSFCRQPKNGVLKFRILFEVKDLI
jgi:hypothetical protein